MSSNDSILGRIFWIFISHNFISNQAAPYSNLINIISSSEFIYIVFRAGQNVIGLSII